MPNTKKILVTGSNGFLGSNLIKSLNRTVATSAMPIGIPGCPEFAF